MADRTGQKLGNYRLIRLLGKGGFAEVYLGEHIYLNTPVAVKVLHTQLESEDMAGFLNEARIIARLMHPHIVRVTDFGLDGETPFLVMDYAPNGTLRQRHPRGTQLPLSTIIPYVKQVADALQHAHNEKLIHRDIKPENILQGHRYEVLLSDFGIATVAHRTSTQHTQMIAGTAMYMAPELFKGRPYPSSDQYALAVVVYEWLCGEPPFNQGDFIQLGYQHTYVPPQPLRERVSTIPHDVEQVLMTALAKDPKQRFMNVQAFAKALEQASQLAQFYPPASFTVPPPVSQSPQPNVATPSPSRFSPSTDAAATSLPSSPLLPTSAVTPPSQLPPSFTVATPLPASAVPPPPPVGPYSGAPTIYGQQSTEISQAGGFTQRPQVQRNSNFGLIVGIFFLLVVLISGSILYYVKSSNPGTGSGNNSTPTAIGTGSGNAIVPAPTGSSIIKIATDFPTSGKDASVGKPTENGAHLAVDQANANHTIPGYTLEFVPKDDVGPSGLHDPAAGTQNVTSLIGDALVAGIVGPFNSNVARAEMPIANNAPIVLISPVNTNPCLTKQGAAVGCVGANDLLSTLRPKGIVNYFRLAVTEDHQGPAGADYLYKTLHLTKVYVIDDAETYGILLGNTFSAEMQKLGGKVLGRSSEPGTTTSFVSLLTQIASSKPDVIYFGGLDATGGTLIRQQMAQVPALKNTPFAGGDGIVTPTFASTIGLNGGPSYGALGGVDTMSSSSAATFRSQYTAVYGANINLYSAPAYDCADILIQAIKKALVNGAHTPQDGSDATGAKTFRQAVINAIQQIDYNGITGHQTFDANGDTTNNIVSLYELADVNGQPDWKYVSQVNVQ